MMLSDCLESRDTFLFIQRLSLLCNLSRDEISRTVFCTGDLVKVAIMTKIKKSTLLLYWYFRSDNSSTLLLSKSLRRKNQV